MANDIRKPRVGDHVAAIGQAGTFEVTSVNEHVRTADLALIATGALLTRYLGLHSAMVQMNVNYKKTPHGLATETGRAGAARTTKAPKHLSADTDGVTICNGHLPCSYLITLSTTPL